MQRRIIGGRLIMATIACAGLMLSGSARADTQAMEGASTSSQTQPYITIEKPVVLQNSEKITEKQVITRSSGLRSFAAKRCAAPRVSYRPVHRLASTSNLNRSNYFMKTIERTTEKPIIVEKPVLIDRPVEKIVEKPVYLERVVEKQVQVEKPVLLEQEVMTKEQPACIERQTVLPATIERPLIMRKEGHHLLNLKLF